jgi:hypothetical protein
MHSGRGKRFYILHSRPDRPAAHLASNVYRGSCLGLKRLGHKYNLSQSYSAEFSNEWSHSSAATYAFMTRTEILLFCAFLCVMRIIVFS